MSNKWWHRIFLFILVTSLGNAHILYMEDDMERHSKRLSQKRKGRKDRRNPLTRAEFHYEIAAWLTMPSFQLGRTGGRFNRNDRGVHESVSAGN
ncbi:hypothetical protein M758_UG185600 [Ceratodon purpureus]|nr:hypothetical protein M758_UG185600 [Ceratodon purpureus]